MRSVIPTKIEGKKRKRERIIIDHFKLNATSRPREYSSERDNEVYEAITRERAFTPCPAHSRRKGRINCLILCKSSRKAIELLKNQLSPTNTFEQHKSISLPSVVRQKYLEQYQNRSVINMLLCITQLITLLVIYLMSVADRSYY